MIAATSPEIDVALEDHFSGVTKMITIGKGGKRKVRDYFLSRRACYLIAQNGDPKKPEIAAAQNYFAFIAFWKLPGGVEILDVMGQEGLAANLFRLTQTDAKLQRDQVQDEDTAIMTHHDVGQEVRQAIENIHQKTPEDLPRAASIRKLLAEKRRKTRNRLKKRPPEEQRPLF
jgi:hypothetical protein